MERRKFLGSLTVFGVSSVAAVPVVRSAQHAAAKAHHGPLETVTYSVAGFTCITCAVGLETILQRTDGVVRVQADYPKALAVVDYDPACVSEPQLREAIAGMGFAATRV